MDFDWFLEALGSNLAGFGIPIESQVHQKIDHMAIFWMIVGLSAFQLRSKIDKKAPPDRSKINKKIGQHLDPIFDASGRPTWLPRSSQNSPKSIKNRSKIDLEIRHILYPLRKITVFLRSYGTNTRRSYLDYGRSLQMEMRKKCVRPMNRTLVRWTVLTWLSRWTAGLIRWLAEPYCRHSLMWWACPKWKQIMRSYRRYSNGRPRSPMCWRDMGCQAGCQATERASWVQKQPVADEPTVLETDNAKLATFSAKLQILFHLA